MNVSRHLRAVVTLTSVVAGVSSCSSSPVVPAAANTPATRPAPARTGTPAVNEGPATVKLSVLDTSQREATDTARNPFRFQAKAPPPAPPRPIVQAPPPPEIRTGPISPPVPAGPPPIPLKFIGLVERANGVRWAVLSDGKRQVYGREADIIDGQYRIVSIGAESIELSYADGRGRQTVRLTGQ